MNSIYFMQYIPNTKQCLTWIRQSNISFLIVHILFNLHKTQGGGDIAKEVLK